MAVKAWTNLADHFTSFEFGQTFLSFDEQVADSYGISESGQIALRITKPDQETKTSLTLDLAAYIFKFKYPQMPIVIGNEEFTGGIMSQLYSNTNNQEIKIKARFY
jgi:hypothetical protein